MTTKALRDVKKQLADRERKLAKWQEENKHSAHSSRRKDSRSNWAYSLKEDGSAAGYSDAEADTLGFNESEGWVDFLISTTTRDLHGDVVVPGGCKETLSYYDKNPVVFFAHRSDQYPIAVAKKQNTLDCPLSLVVEEDRIYSRAYFHLSTQESEDVFKLCTLGILKGTSIGFVPIFGELIEPAEQDDSGNDVDFDFGGIVFHKWRLLEYSVVPVAANPDAYRSFVSRSKSLSPLVKNTLTGLYRRPDATASPGVCLKELYKMPMDDLVAPPTQARPKDDPKNSDDGSRGQEEGDEQKDAVQAVLFDPQQFMSEDDVCAWLQAHGMSDKDVHVSDPNDGDSQPHIAVQFVADLCEPDTARREDVPDEEGVTFVYCTKAKQEDDNEDNKPEGDLEHGDKGANKSMDEPVQDAEAVSSPETPQEDEMPYGCKMLCELAAKKLEVHALAARAIKKSESPKLQKFMGKMAGKVCAMIEEINAFGEGEYEEYKAVEVPSLDAKDGKNKKPSKEDDSGDDEDDKKPSEDGKKSLVAANRVVSKMAKKDVAVLTEASDCFEELSSEDNLKKSQRAACRLHASNLRTVETKYAANVEEDSSKSLSAKDEAAILKAIEEAEATQKLLRDTFYGITGQEV